MVGVGCDRHTTMLYIHMGINNYAESSARVIQSHAAVRVVRAFRVAWDAYIGYHVRCDDL